MTCNESRRLLSLYRQGELSAEETRAVKEHLGSCPACSRVERELETVNETIRRIRLQEPILDDQVRFSSEVMSELSRGASRQERTWIEILLLPAERPAVRALMLAVVILAVVSFGAQTYETLANVHQIEVRFSRQQATTGKERVCYEVDLSQVRVTREQEDLLLMAKILSQAGSRVLITDETLKGIWSFVNRHSMTGNRSEALIKNLDWSSLLQALRPSTRARLVFPEHG